MFHAAIEFNDPTLYVWDTGSLTDISSMFDDSSHIFDQDLTSWELANISDWYACQNFGNIGNCYPEKVLELACATLTACCPSQV